MSALLLGLASSNNASKTYVDDVFSAYTYTGNGGTQTINNGIDLAGKGGLVWMKCRSFTYGHGLVDTVRTRSKILVSSTTSPEASSSAPYDLTSFNSNGFSVGGAQNLATNVSGHTFASWTFRKAPKFFDVVTYTGTGTTQTINHNLGSAPGCIFVKATSGSSNWCVYHRGIGNTQFLSLNLTNAAATLSMWGNTDPTSTTFTTGGFQAVGELGTQYVAYLFAHDTSADGLIQCGTFTTNGSGKVAVSLGWEAQWLMVKNVATGSWIISDVSRGMPVGGNTAYLLANIEDAEVANTNFFDPTATGFTFNAAGTGVTYVYMTIRRPNKPPTSGTQVYNAVARTGTGVAATVTGVGFAPDLVIPRARDAASGANPTSSFYDRLRGATVRLMGSGASAEQNTSTTLTSFEMNGMEVSNDPTYYNINTNVGGQTYINHFFKRAPGFFDVVCYTGAGSATTVAHSLAAVPELIIVKSRSFSDSWYVPIATPAFATGHLIMELPNAKSAYDLWPTKPTASVFTTFNSNSATSINGATHVAYLFASLPGISKVGSYTGNGTSQTINCGFAAGARFVLIKRTDASGDWYVWDTARGIITANDPHLSLNSAAGEVTTNDSLDPAASGFIVNQVAATNINVSAATYIFLAIA